MVISLAFNFPRDLVSVLCFGTPGGAGSSDPTEPNCPVFFFEIMFRIRRFRARMTPTGANLANSFQAAAEWLFWGRNTHPPPPAGWQTLAWLGPPGEDGAVVMLQKVMENSSAPDEKAAVDPRKYKTRLCKCDSVCVSVCVCTCVYVCMLSVCLCTLHLCCV